MAKCNPFNLTSNPNTLGILGHARFISVFFSFLFCIGALRFQKLSVESSPISIRAGPIIIPIIKSSFN
ncbi:hypothetical protein PHAVU_007G104600 [Phaseolus vulgaris]|uniref:Uncharacterized protein n=1 Tax=Phaseolus vulgaris TaxID=3885 RepID=V7BD98_PHAVU|nr:hypothetical protein PHAVU_007G104600g [Phaseolus vulgaris]ESW15817.1 hypothetical protein PHAVU_007G104600g [Phaseolus vulgaris]